MCVSDRCQPARVLLLRRCVIHVLCLFTYSTYLNSHTGAYACMHTCLYLCIHTTSLNTYVLISAHAHPLIHLTFPWQTLTRSPITSDLRCSASPSPSDVFIDHNGFIFLDDSRMKNFTSCIKGTNTGLSHIQRGGICRTREREVSLLFITISLSSPAS